MDSRELDQSRDSSSPQAGSDETLARICFRGEPLANPENTVPAGRARFTLLTPRLLRLEWSEIGEWEDRASYAFPNRHGPALAYRSRMEGGTLVIDTGALHVRYRPDGRFTPENLSIAIDPAGEAQTKTGGVHPTAIWRPRLADAANLYGTRRTLDECAGDASLDDGLLSRAGWALFDDSQSVLFADDGWPIPRPEHELQDWYFFGYGHDYKTALAAYARFGGPIPLIPRYVLGAWWSRYWAYSDQDLKDLVDDFARHDLPLDVLVVDMDWHTTHTWTGYTWNRDLFPDPPGFLRWVHDQGLQVTLNLHPALGVQAFEEAYPRFAQAMGVDPKSGEAIPFRITDRRFVKLYFELLHHPLEEDGVDFWWMDWQQGETSELKGLDPLPWINHVHFRDSARRDRRPMLYSRWGGLGNHRYPIGFSGDTFVTWQALQFQPYMTATASNVAYGWWSHDIGGHMGGATEPELFARWVQFGALSPCLRLHATKDALAIRRPWKYPDDVYQACREAFHLRYRLVPYLYTMARLAHDTGISLCRPMYYDHPEEKAAYAARYQYFLGDQIIAAPIVFPADPDTGLAATDVWLPEGTWIDIQTRESFTGPRWVRLVGGLDRVPMLVRAGAILPLASPSRTTGITPRDHLVLSVFPGIEGEFRLYEDDGLTDAYKEGHCEWTQIRTRLEGENVWLVEVEAVEGHCAELSREREYEIRLEGSHRPQWIKIDGTDTAGWSYDAASMTTIIDVPKRDKRCPLAVMAGTEGGISALGRRHNRETALADVKHLLGDWAPGDPGDADAILASDAPGQLDAVARMGGPFVHFVEFVTPQEASRQLGRVVAGAPADARDDFAVQAQFSLSRGGATQRYVVQMAGAGASQILETPFRYDGRVRPSRWSAEVRLTWRGETLTYNHKSSPLFPTIYAWRVLVCNKEESDLQPEHVLDDQGRLDRTLAWRYHHQAGSSSLANLTDAHAVRLAADYGRQLAAGEPLAAYVATTITSPDVRNVVLLAWTRCRATWFLNGQSIGFLPMRELETAQPPFYWPTRESGVLQLQAGQNTLVVVSSPSESVRESTGLPYWRLGGALTTPDGEVMTDLEFG
jgi:alpha-glucosidase